MLADIGYYVEPTSIKDNMEIVGAYLGGTHVQAVLYKGGTIHNLRSVPGDSWADPSGVNDDGVIIGSVEGSTFDAVRFIQGTAAQSLGHPEGYTLSSAAAINEQGAIVGFSDKPDACQGKDWPYYAVATMYSVNSAPRIVLSHAIATAINQKGEIAVETTKLVL